MSAPCDRAGSSAGTGRLRRSEGGTTRYRVGGLLPPSPPQRPCMQQLTPTAFQAVQNLSQRYGVSVDAVTTLLAAVNAGGGSMAQFYHPELGGGGQWMRGGMT